MKSISKNDIKRVRLLQQKKHRDETGLFVAEGRKAVEELEKGFELTMLVNEENATAKEIEQMSSLRTPQGVIGVFHQRSTEEYVFRNPDELVLALDDVQDPGNLGTIIRTADWFGVRHVVCSKGTADCYNPKVVQATMGALARVHVHYTDLTLWLKEQREKNKDLPIYGTLLEGENIYTHPLRKGGIVVMGNEGNGLSAEVRDLLTDRLYVPSYPMCVETSESLNVAIATSVVLAEFRRRIAF